MGSQKGRLYFHGHNETIWRYSGDVTQSLEYVIFERGLKVYMPTGFGIIEITEESLEITLIFGRLDVKLMNKAA